MNDFQEQQYIGRAEILKALGHPIRLAMAELLMDQGSVNVTRIYTTLNLPQSTVSLHLTRLRQGGVVKGTRHGLEVYYELGDERVRTILQALR
ncbi:ArsR/SmtB family transcription factor [Ectobacillus ponti]|uniref:Metalloregulator ArsR/SmtB family transcription factor n=1 Tax=Ectobacillus ponti TaxID=2961894 RepID=A0AA42BNL5_9BACI|nr:metalloregulator ArsR/SmtB family transcription factor [Ectobacillus ponti]MCP8967797.1 metalloregulator ArsR/SmtB family transcription factor [Ectobacillus ponti]